MKKYNKNNDVVKYKYFKFIENCENGKDPKTVKQFANAIHEFEVATGFKDFRSFNSEWAIDFKDYLNDKRNQRTGLNISRSYFLHYLSHVRNFLTWIRENVKGYAKIKKADIAYMHITRNEKSQARAVNHPESHSVQDVIATIRKMPESNVIEKRNKAMMSLFILTCPRISSLQESRIEHIRYFDDYNSWAFMQDPRFTVTKGSVFIKTFLIGEVQDIIHNVINWKKYLESESRQGQDYLFPKITPSFTKEGDNILVLSKENIKSQTVIRNIVKNAYENNGLKYIKPHNFRHTIARHVRKSDKNVTDTLIALAENMGQKNGYSTLVASYAGDPLENRAKLMKAVILE